MNGYNWPTNDDRGSQILAFPAELQVTFFKTN